MIISQPMRPCTWKLCNKSISSWLRGEVGIRLVMNTCLLRRLSLVSVKSIGLEVLIWVLSSSACGADSSCNVWILKPPVLVCLSFQDTKEGREDLSLIRVNESVRCQRLCCLLSILLPQLRSASQGHPGADPECFIYIDYCSLFAQGEARLQLQLSGSLLTRGKQIMLANT